MIESIDKPALSALWPNKNGMNIVLDLGANIDCNEKNLVDFSLMGSALHKSLFEGEEAKVALLNIGSEEVKGNNIIKNTYQILNKAIYGHLDAKTHILQVIGKWIKNCNKSLALEKQTQLVLRGSKYTTVENPFAVDPFVYANYFRSVTGSPSNINRIWDTGDRARVCYGQETMKAVPKV